MPTIRVAQGRPPSQALSQLSRVPHNLAGWSGIRLSAHRFPIARHIDSRSTRGKHALPLATTRLGIRRPSDASAAGDVHATQPFCSSFARPSSSSHTAHPTHTSFTPPLLSPHLGSPSDALHERQKRTFFRLGAHNHPSLACRYTATST